MYQDSADLLLVGNSPYGNRGCEAIVRGTVEAFAHRISRPRFVLTSLGEEQAYMDKAGETDCRVVHCPSSYTARFSWDWWKYRFLLRPPWLWANKQPFPVEMRGARRCDCVVILAGDNYTLDYGKEALQTHLDLNEALLGKNKPVVFWGASIGPISAEPDMERVMADHLRRADLVMARESETVAYLDALGVHDNVILMADPAFIMQPIEPALPEYVSELLDGSAIGVNISSLAARYSGSDERGWCRTVVEFLTKLARSVGGPVILVPHVIWPHNDHQFLGSLMSGLGDLSSRFCLLPPNMSAAELKWVISKLRLFIGARTHSTIAAISSGVPTISLGYSQKAKGINKDVFGNLDWLVPVKDLQADALLEKCSELVSQEVAVRAQLVRRVPEMLAMVDNAAEEVIRVYSPTANQCV